MTRSDEDGGSDTDRVMMFQLGSLLLLSGVSAGIGYAIGEGSFFVVFAGIAAWVGALVVVLAISGSMRTAEPSR